MNNYKNYINGLCNKTETREELTLWVDTVLTNYLKENPENQGEIEHILDYFIAKDKKLSKRNKKLRLKKMSYKDAKRLSKEWVEKMNKKAGEIVETEDDVSELKKLGNGLRLVKLVGENAYKREGKLMSHCVGSYFGKSNVEIYSIRDNKNMPHCTMEITDKDVNQIKGKGNGSIHPRYIGAVLKALKFIGKEIRKSELIYLGYRELTDETFKFYNERFKDFKYMNYQGSVFMYVNQKFESKTC